MSAPKYWFARSAVKEEWLIQDLGRWSYPVNWRGSLLILGVVLVPIALLLLSVPLVLNWPDWALGVYVIVVAGGSTLLGIVAMQRLTDPKLTIEHYRAMKRAAKNGDPGGPA